MRPFEIILISVLMASILLATIATRVGALPGSFLPRLAALCLLLAILAFAVHLVVEGAHWQMFAGYAALLPAVILVCMVGRSSAATHWMLPVTAFLLIAICCLCSYVVPMFRLPMPTGPYAVGTSILYMVDDSRMEDGSPAPGAKRELVVQLWYPAVPGREQFAPYRRRQETTFESSYQAVLPTHSRMDAPVMRAAPPYPVLLFNPAWNGRRTQNTFLTEELASHGYIVAAIDHTYNSQPVAFPDGRVVWATPVPPIETMIDTTPDEVEQAGNHETDKEAADDRFVLDQLAELNRKQGSRWYGAMDTDNAGAFGHSLGGAVAVETWATDSRVRAAVNMDGWQFGTQAVRAVRAASESPGAPANTYPLLYLYESLDNSFNAPPSNLANGKTHWSATEVEAAVSAWDVVHVSKLLKRYGGQALVLQGSIHPTFIDKPLTSPISRLSGRSEIDTRRAHLIIRDYVVQFFDQALKGKPSPLLNGGANTYPEMKALVIPASSAQARQP
jgi:predicted dienelactone hydrolase